MSFGVILGVVLGLVGVLSGPFLGSGISSVIQPKALFVVVLGTWGAVLIAFPLSEVKKAMTQALRALRGSEFESEKLIVQISELASLARKEGFLALDVYRSKLNEPLLSGGIKYLMDGFDSHAIRELMDSQISQSFNEDVTSAKVWEASGSFAPTMGVIGAILGLIEILSKLDDPSQLGSGIAVAFVATLYGLFASNLFLLPIANRIRQFAQTQMLPKEMIKVAILGIQEGLNPHLVEEKLRKLAT
jgi:chemotaxis protein MotA